VVIAVAFNCWAKYSGDGMLIHHGPLAANDRYVLDLGLLDLTKKSTTEFRVVGLPAERFVAGIQLTKVRSAMRVDKDAISAVVQITIRNQGDGTIVLQAAGPLREWTWSVASGHNEAFVYGGYGANASTHPTNQRCENRTF
jgi:hypothetical protein